MADSEYYTSDSKVDLSVACLREEYLVVRYRVEFPFYLLFDVFELDYRVRTAVLYDASVLIERMGRKIYADILFLDVQTLEVAPRSRLF